MKAELQIRLCGLISVAIFKYFGQNQISPQGSAYLTIQTFWEDLVEPYEKTDFVKIYK